MKLYVGNLSFNTTESSLRVAFEPFGQVTSASIVMDRETGRSRGFGFVEFSSADEGNAAIEGMHGKNLDGRDLTVNEARPREERAPTGGGHRTEGGGGGFGAGRIPRGTLGSTDRGRRY